MPYQEYPHPNEPWIVGALFGVGVALGILAVLLAPFLFGLATVMGFLGFLCLMLAAAAYAIWHRGRSE